MLPIHYAKCYSVTQSCEMEKIVVFVNQHSCGLPLPNVLKPLVVYNLGQGHVTVVQTGDKSRGKEELKGIKDSSLHDAPLTLSSHIKCPEDFG